jgi:large subunit ribosomal protein L9
MKVLLIADVEKLGWLGDIVDVNTGYARNYLLPHNLAKVPTEANLRSIAEEKVKHAEQRLQETKHLADACEKVRDAEVVIAAKANELGHLFGSVIASDIAGNLREQGFDVTDRIVRLDEHIKQVGTHNVRLKFAEELTCQVSVVVVAKDDENDISK